MNKQLPESEQQDAISPIDVIDSNNLKLHNAVKPALIPLELKLTEIQTGLESLGDIT